MHHLSLRCCCLLLIPAASLAQVSYNWTVDHAAGGPNPSTLQTTIVAAQPGTQASVTVSYETQSGGGWLSATPTSGTTPLTITGHFAPGNLGVGTYTGTVTVRGGNSVVIHVTLNVREVSFTANRSQLIFDRNFGDATPTPYDTVTIRSDLPSSFQRPRCYPMTVALFTESGGSWLQTGTIGCAGTVALPGPNTSVRAAPAGLAVGTYRGRLDFLIVDFNRTVSVPVTLTVRSTPSLAPAITSVTDGASFRPAISQASWITVSGRNLASVSRTWAVDDFAGDALPKSLSGTSVAVNGKPASVYFVSPTQLNVLTPVDNSVGSVVVSVNAPGGTASRTVTMNTAAPAFFMLDPEGRKFVAAVHPDGVIAGRTGLFIANPSATRPARPGDRLMIFGTGWGLTSPAQPDGFNFTDARSLVQASAVQILIGQTPARIEFAGAVSPGLYQFNILVPNLVPGDYPIIGELNGMRTQTGASLTIDQ